MGSRTAGDEMSAGYSCHRHEGALEPVAALLHPGQPVSTVVEELERTYVRHPHGPGSLWVCRKDGAIAALLAAARRRFLVDGASLDGAILTDLIVDPAHRRRGLMQVLLAQAFEDLGAQGCSLLYGLPNEAALPGHRKFGGWTEIGALSSVSAMPSVLFGVLRRASRLLPRPVGQRVAPLLGRASRPLTAPPRRCGSYTIEVETPSDAELDRLFAEAAGGAAIGVRDAAFHRWRFGGGPLGPARVVYARRRGVLEGYMALRTVLSGDGAPVTQVLDVLGVGAAPRLLLSLAPDLARRHEAVEVSFPRFGESTDVPWALARHRLTPAVVIVRSPDGTLSDQDLRRAPFHFTLADSDVA